MKRITDLDGKMPHPEDDASDEQRAQMPTLRRLLRFIAVGVAPKSAEESDNYAQAAMKLRVDGATADMEDAEFNLLFRKVEENVLAWPAHIHNRVLNALREAKARKVDVIVAEAK